MTTSTLIREIQNHLEQFRTVKTGIPLEHLSPEDVSIIKGYTTKRLPEPDYKRSWAKLAKAQRLNRLMDYHHKLTCDYQLNAVQQQQLKTLFYESVDTIDRDTINYNQTEGHITKIEGLKCDTDGCFYFERSRPTSTPPCNDIPIQTIKKFTPISMTKITAAQTQKKTKVVIVRKPTSE